VIIQPVDDYGAGLTPFTASNDPEVMRAKIWALQEAMTDMPQVDCPVRHIFAPGLYAREMTIPKGVTAVGAVHKTEHVTTISKGRMLLMTDEGIQEVSAGYTGVSKPGIKRAAYALEDTVMVCYHPTNETDLDKLAEELTDCTTQQLVGGSQNKQFIANQAKQLKG
jgi:quercetin dioxygenase-like cupin family protein